MGHWLSIIRGTVLYSITSIILASEWGLCQVALSRVEYIAKYILILGVTNVDKYIACNVILACV
jgi:hypothetical protein